jgi:hypothetical protein
MLEHIFVTYKREEESYLNLVLELLKSHYIPFWYDRHLQATEEWLKEINVNLRKAFAVIVILTPQSASSHYVTYEWAWARGQGIPVLPILFEDMKTKDSPLSYIQHISWKEHNSEEKIVRKIFEIQSEPNLMFLKFWKRALNPHYPVTLALPLHSADSLFENRSEYTHAISFPEAFALSELMHAFSDLRHYNLVQGIPYTVAGDKVTDLQHNIISIGGTLSNNYTKLIWEEIGHRIPYLNMADDDPHGYKHKATGKVLVPTPSSGVIKKDYGIIVIANNPFCTDSSRKVILLLGCYAYGSLAAARMLTMRYVKEIWELTNKLDEFVFPLQVSVHGDFVGDPKLASGYEVEPLDN